MRKKDIKGMVLKTFSMALAGCLSASVAMMPLTLSVKAETAKKAINLISEQNPSGSVQGKGSNYIYFGKDTSSDNYFDACFKVLDAGKTNTGDAGMFLVSDRLVGDPDSDYGGVMFNPGTKFNNIYQGSNAQNWCSTFLDSNFSPVEQDAMIATTKSDSYYSAHVVFWDNGEEKFYDQPYEAVENILNGDKLFPLSAEEADNTEYGFTSNNMKTAMFGNGTGFYWLRSPIYNVYYKAGDVCALGRIGHLDVRGDICMRPAFNLDTSKVLLTSAATGGKESGEAGADCLNAVNGYSKNTWKLTVKDESRGSFRAEFDGKENDTVLIRYTDAKTTEDTGGNEFISAIIVNSAGEITCYGNIKALQSADDANGSVALNLSGKFEEGDTLYVFNEQCNGDKKTDYSSSLILITEPPEYPVVTLTKENNGVRISWEGVPGASKYRIFKKEGSGDFAGLTKLSETSYVDKRVEAGKTYTYTVRCIDANGKYVGGYDTEGQSITLPAEIKADITLSNTSKGVKISWDAADGAASYRIFRKEEGETAFTGIKKTTALSYTDKSIEPGRTYYYYVRCINADGKYIGTFDANETGIDVPAEIKADITLSKTSKGIKISWNAVDGVASYRIFKKAEGETTFTGIKKTTGTAYTDKAVEAGKTYTYYVRCIDANGKYVGTYDVNGMSMVY